MTATPPVATIRLALGTEADLHLVGGTVRDMLSGVSPKDIDLATVLPPEAVMQRLELGKIHTVPTGLRHGTVLAVVDGEHIEITTFRSVRSDGTVGFGTSIEADLAARDFTVNAIAFSLNTESIIDPCGGGADIAQNILRAVGSATSRFREDPLRILRCIRFGPAAGRRVTAETADAAKALAPSITSVSPERIRDELLRILLSPHVADGFRALHEYGLLQETLPELVPAVGFEQNDFHDHDVFEHTLKVIETTPQEDTLLRLTALFHDIGKPYTLSVDENGNRHFYRHEEVGTDLTKTAMRRLRFSNDDIDAVTLLVRQHMRPVDCGPPGVRRLMRDLGELFSPWLEFKQADAHSCKGPNPVFDADVKRFEEMVAEEKKRAAGPVYGKLALNGDDLKELGIAPGPGMGAILKQLEEFVIEDPERNTKELLVQEVQRLKRGR